MLVLLLATLSTLGGHVTLASGQSNTLGTSGIDLSMIDVESLHRTLENLDAQLNDLQNRACALGLHSRLCSRYYMEHAGFEGKDSVDTGYDVIDDSNVGGSAHAMLENLVDQRRAISTLKKLLEAMRESSSDVKQPSKRSCRFRLGGHCLTEALDRAANQYYYLKSPDSPGRRRRSAQEINQHRAR